MRFDDMFWCDFVPAGDFLGHNKNVSRFGFWLFLFKKKEMPAVLVSTRFLIVWYNHIFKTWCEGDVLFFNRALCHRGGRNLSSKRRNSLIMQCVWLWGVGQEIIESSKVIENLAKSEIYEKMTKEQKDEFYLRIKAPYPLSTKLST